MPNNAKSTENFKKTIEKYLTERAQKDSLFAASFSKPSKNIDDCITYIINTVEESGCSAFSDEEVYSMAVHYYDEDGIKVGSKRDCTIVTNQKVDLTPEEIAEAKSEAKQKIIAEEYNSLKKKTSTPKSEKEETGVLQGSLFDAA